jgi:hypothetical protein
LLWLSNFSILIRSSNVSLTNFFIMMQLKFFVNKSCVRLLKRRYTCRQRTGLCDVGGFENLPPGTAAQLKNKCTKKVQKMIEKLLPEPKPNSEPMLMGIDSAPYIAKPNVACWPFKQFN